MRLFDKKELLWYGIELLIVVGLLVALWCKWRSL